MVVDICLACSYFQDRGILGILVVKMLIKSTKTNDITMMFISAVTENGLFYFSALQKIRSVPKVLTFSMA